MRQARDERGTASIELVVMIPLLLMVTLMVLQVAIAGWTVAQTQQASRQAARALSLGEPVRGAAEASLPDSLKVYDIDEGTDSVTLWVKVPSLSALPDITVKRDASMPPGGLS